MSFDPSTRLPVGKLSAGLLGPLLATFGPGDPDVIVGAGVGRDAAAIAFGDRILVVKTDPITFASDNAAAYLVEVNANDLACLGAMPRWMLVTALLPAGITAGAVGAQFEALRLACRARGIALVGGHTEVTAGIDRMMLVGCLLGETTPERLLRPGGARPGDRLLLTKSLAIEGTALLATELGSLLEVGIGRELRDRARALLDSPGISVLNDAQTLLATGGITALHDVTEGGLAMAVREIAAAAEAGAWLDTRSIPLLTETTAIAGYLGLDPLGMLGSGSLLATAAPEAVPGLIAAAAAAGFAVHDIGQVLPSADGIHQHEGGTVTDLPTFDTDEVSRALDEFRNQRPD
ncbi:MAG: AIR synthase-related protein [Chloroflexota bacterium]|nr:AIR synthase-related protein [Chloroflexota bacterium]